MSTRRTQKIDLGQQLGFLGRLSTILLGGGLLALFLVWKQVECGRLRAELFEQQGKCSSLLAENGQLRAARLGLVSYSRIQRLAGEELGMVAADGRREWITVAGEGLLPREGRAESVRRTEGYACAR